MAPTAPQASVMAEAADGSECPFLFWLVADILYTASGLRSSGHRTGREHSSALACLDADSGGCAAWSTIDASAVALSHFLGPIGYRRVRWNVGRICCPRSARPYVVLARCSGV